MRRGVPVLHAGTRQTLIWDWSTWPAPPPSTGTNGEDCLALVRFAGSPTKVYVLVVGLILTAGLVYGASILVGPKYLVTSNTLLLPPKTLNPQGKLINPYLNLGGLEGIGDVVVKDMTSRTALDAAGEANITGEYEMYRDPAVAAPVLYLSVQDSSAAGALATQAYLLKTIPQTLERVQETTAEVRAETFVVSTVVTEDSTPQVVRRSQLRAMIMALVAGLGGTYLATGVIDGALRGRRHYADDTDLPRVSNALHDALPFPPTPARRPMWLR